MRPLLVLFLVTALSAGAADDLPVSGPVLGYAWDAGLSRLRPILGIPGSSLLGAPVDPGLPLALAEVSPSQDYALGVHGANGELLVVRFPALTVGRVAGVGGVTRIAISPSGSAAAVYSQDIQALWILTGLPDAPLAAQVPLPGAISALAVNDAGDLALAVAPEQLFAQLFALGPGAEPRLLGPAGAGLLLAFLERSSDALIADPARREVTLLRGLAERVVLAGERDGVVDPVAVAAAGRRVLVADRGAAAVLVVDLGGGPPVRVDCPCGVASLQRLRGDAVFRVTATFQSASWLVEAGGEQPRLWFVPPDPPPARPPRDRSFQERSR